MTTYTNNSPLSSNEKDLINALDSEDFFEIKKLVDQGVRVDINNKNRFGHTQLMHAAKINDHYILELLLSSFENIDINATDDEGYTALMTAIFYNRIENVRLLLNANASTTPESIHDGYTACRLAKCTGNQEILDLLNKKQIAKEV